jgi:hypothetical protein
MKRQKESNYNTSQNVQQNITNRVNRTMNLYIYVYVQTISATLLATFVFVSCFSLASINVSKQVNIDRLISTLRRRRGIFFLNSEML